MRHGRADYNRRIQDAERIIPDEDPVFLMRGQDKASVAGARAYAEVVRAMGGSEIVVQRALDQADAMEAWQRTHEPRMPD